MAKCAACNLANSRMKRKDSATSAAVVSARSRGRAHRDHQEELRREGDAGVDANVIPALAGAHRIPKSEGGAQQMKIRPLHDRLLVAMTYLTLTTKINDHTMSDSTP